MQRPPPILLLDKERALENSLLVLKTIDPETQEVGIFSSFTEDLPVG
jgi:hypothetical protein